MEKVIDKIKVVVVSDNIDYRLLIKQLLNTDDVVVAGYANCNETALEKIKGFYPDMVILTCTSQAAAIFELSQQIYHLLPGCGVVLMSESMDLQLLNKAMESGIRKVLSINCSSQELLDTIYKVCLSERQRLPDDSKVFGHKSRVISFFGGKGGTGKTTLAVNTAITLAQMGRKTIIIDADLQFGDVNLLLNIDSKDTISELVQEKNAFSIDTIKSFTVMHSSGVSVLCAPKSPEYAEYVTGSHIESIINTVRPYYEYIILDLTPSFNDITLAAVENSDKVFLVTGLDITGLRNIKICVNIFDSLHQKDKLSLIINKEGPSIINVRDFQNIIGLPIEARIHEDTKTAVDCLNKGIPVVIAAPRAQISREIKAFAEKLNRDMA